MASAGRYRSSHDEHEILARWALERRTEFDAWRDGALYAIDTPPPTISGALHLGHVFSYSHADFHARYHRMRGERVFYPMGWDDNGLPTERLAEQVLGDRAVAMGRAEFRAYCLELGERYAADYRALFERLGLSVDWRYTYRTIDPAFQRLAQRAFLDHLAAGRAYRADAPTLWCPECRTALAQADVDEIERETTLFTLEFPLEGGGGLPIATTRPELLPACVAIFVHPDDPRYADLAGRRARVPLAGHAVPILTDPAADPAKGSGAVMCCTFGDRTDLDWWRRHRLESRIIVRPDGRLDSAAGELAGLRVIEARARAVAWLEAEGALLSREASRQSVPVHERCVQPIETLVSPQWSVSLLDARERLLSLAERVDWHPRFMAARYRAWVEGLAWDWGISRQRRFGVPIPLWHCDACAETIPADRSALPVDPHATPAPPCPACGATDGSPDPDVMDTWATSSLSFLRVADWLRETGIDDPLPLALRPQAHEIIRTWAFYTLVQAHHLATALPWKSLLISGWALAPAGSEKLSKSRGGGALAPEKAFERWGADPLRYWAACAPPGRDHQIDTERIAAGERWVSKLASVARFATRFIGHGHPVPERPGTLTTADRWMLARLAQLIDESGRAWEDYEHARARTLAERFFWDELAADYLEMVKLRLYDEEHPAREGARYTLDRALRVSLKLIAPILPFITERLWLDLFADERDPSIHTSRWPDPEPWWADEDALLAGEQLREIAGAVRRYKSERSLSLGAPLDHLTIVMPDGDPGPLADAVEDIRSVTRAGRIRWSDGTEPTGEAVVVPTSASDSRPASEVTR